MKREGIRKVWWEYMTRDRWKCPHAGCEVESGRRWNLERHIKTAHQGEGIPVKNISSANIDQLPWKDIKYTFNVPSNLYASHPKRSYSYPSSWDYDHLNIYRRNKITM
jgi:hypothetical protein